MRRAWLLSSLLAGMLLCGCASSPTPHKIAWRTLARGIVSGITEPRRQVIRDEVSWFKAWAEHAAEGTRLAMPPVVNFTNEMVIVVAMGTKPTGGYLIEVVDAELRGKRLRILVGERNPPPGAIQFQMTTAPVQMIALPAMAARVHYTTVREQVQRRPPETQEQRSHPPRTRPSGRSPKENPPSPYPKGT